MSSLHILNISLAQRDDGMIEYRQTIVAHAFLVESSMPLLVERRMDYAKQTQGT